VGQARRPQSAAADKNPFTARSSTTDCCAQAPPNRYEPAVLPGGNGFVGETLPTGSYHTCSISGWRAPNLAAPHVEILRRDGCIGVWSLGTSKGTIVNGTTIIRSSLNVFVPLMTADNSVIAGRADSPSRFRIQLAES
jgi:hypothetical protein